MKFSVADLLDQLPAGEPLPITKLEKALGLSNSRDKAMLLIGVDALVKLGLLEQAEQGLQRCDTPELIPARLRCSSKGFCFALREDGGEDIYIRDHELNHAWNGDRVLVQVTREGGRRRSPEGGVRCILARQTTSMLAQVEEQNERLVALPLDDRLLTAALVALLPERQSVLASLLQTRRQLGQLIRWHLQGQRQQVGRLEERLQQLHPRQLLQQRRQTLRQNQALLRALSPEQVLRRGFSLIRSAEGELLRSVGAVRPGTQVVLEWADGRAVAEVREIGPKPSADQLRS